MFDLRKWRLSLDWTQAKAGEELGVPPETISRWEKGRMKIARPKMLELACRQLKTDEQFGTEA